MTLSDKIRKMLNKGVAPKAVAKKLKCSAQTVYSLKYKDKKGKEEAAWVEKLDAVKNKAAARVAEVQAERSLFKWVANEEQVGGAHYRQLDPQPWDVIGAWGLGFLDGNVVKYVARYRSKGGIEDLKKAQHYLTKLIETNGKE